MQEAADRLTVWAEKWCLQVNTEKFCTTLSHYLQSRQLVLLESATPLCASGGSSILGSDFDKRMTWKSHLTNAETKAMQNLAILRNIAGTNCQWGAHEKILKSVYQSTIRPVLEFGSTEWMASAKGN